MYIKLLSGLAGLDAIDGQTNAGGLRQLRLIPVEQLERIIWPSWNPASDEPNAVVPYQITGQSLLYVGDAATWLNVEVMPEYASYSEPMEISANGPYYRQAIQIVLPKDRPAITAWCARYARARFVAAIQDANGFSRLVGTTQQPLRLGIDASLGAGKNGRNARTITFSASTPAPALYIDAIDDANLFGQGAFSLAFGWAFDS